MRPTVFLAHAEADHHFARQLADFLEFGCNVVCYIDDGLILSGGNLIAKAEEGLTADVLVLLLSQASCPAPWVREKWEPVLFGADVELFTIQLKPCKFPALLSKRNFFDATNSTIAAMRSLKRWLLHRNTASPAFSSDLEDLYAGLADRAGILEASGDVASRFAREASHDFEAVLWVPSHGRSLAQIAGDLGAQLGLILEGTAEQNCRKIQDVLSQRRCLLVLDAPAPELVSSVVPSGRTSALVTSEPVFMAETADSLADALALVSSRRYAEAYELFYKLLHAGIQRETCARELTWICERWERIEEANSLRFHYGPHPSEQLVLF